MEKSFHGSTNRGERLEDVKIAVENRVGGTGRCSSQAFVATISAATPLMQSTRRR